MFCCATNMRLISDKDVLLMNCESAIYKIYLNLTLQNNHWIHCIMCHVWCTWSQRELSLQLTKKFLRYNTFSYGGQVVYIKPITWQSRVLSTELLHWRGSENNSYLITESCPLKNVAWENANEQKRRQRACVRPVNQVIPSVGHFHEYCSCSDCRNEALFF